MTYYSTISTLRYHNYILDACGMFLEMCKQFKINEIHSGMVKGRVLAKELYRHRVSKLTYFYIYIHSQFSHFA